MKLFRQDIKFKSIKDILNNKKDKSTLEKNEKSIEDDDTESPIMDEWFEKVARPTKKNKVLAYIERYSIIVYAVIAFLINFLIETISRHSFVEAYNYYVNSTQVFLYNTFVIFVTLTLSYLVRKRIFALIMIGGTWMVGGIANGVVLSFRTTPFTGTDLKMLDSAASVASKYISIDQFILAAILVVAVICIFIFIYRRAPKYKGNMKYKRNIAFIILMFASIIPITKYCVAEKIVATYFGNIVIAYEDYGFPYCFWCTVIAKGIDCPNNYKESVVKNILRKDGDDSYNTKKTPNIIIVQLESFFDPKLMKGLTFSEDPIPNFRKLEKNFTSGYVTVPVVGAGTVNSEFEILTGMSLRFFGPGEYPYKTILTKNVCESVAYDLKSIGYSTHAIHNNDADFYGRNTILSRLGFDTFTSLEMMKNIDYTALGWAKDAVLTNSIMDCLNSTEGQDFVFTISVQSHGGYPSEQLLQNQKISVSGTNNEENKNSIEYYVNQINEVDKFIGVLVETLSEKEEDTILILYGDHLPSLGLKSKDLYSGSIYKTEYVIWDNMGLKAKDNDLKAYQLASIALDRVGIHVGTLMKFHQERLGTKHYYSDLDTLQYDMLYGERYAYDGEDRFEEIDMRMGLSDIVISSILFDLQGNVIIKGENFNSFSKVKVNDKDIDTTYVNENTLTIPGMEINFGDTFEVDQVSSTEEVLREGIIFTY